MRLQILVFVSGESCMVPVEISCDEMFSICLSLMDQFVVSVTNECRGGKLRYRRCNEVKKGLKESLHVCIIVDHIEHLQTLIEL